MEIVMKKITLFFIMSIALIGCDNNKTDYEYQINIISEKYLADREEALNDLFRTKVLETTNSKVIGFEKLAQIASIDKDFQTAFDEVNHKYGRGSKKIFNNQKIFTELNINTDLLLSAKYLYIKGINFGLNFFIRIIFVFALVLIFASVSLYSIKFDLFKIIFSHRIIIGFLTIIGLFFSPATYFEIVKNTQQQQVEVLTKTNLSVTKGILKEIQ